MSLKSKLSAAAFVAFVAMSVTAIPASAQPKKCEEAGTYPSCGSFQLHVLPAQRLHISTIPHDTIPHDTSPAYMKYTDPRYNSSLSDAGGGGGGR